MKKFFIAILALLYISTSTGATLHMHYCMGELADWGFGQKDSKYCSNCGMLETDQKDKGCCKDENKFLKNDADQKTTELAFQLIQLTSVSLPPSFVEITFTIFPAVTENNIISHLPPRNYGVAVYIRNCVFLI